MPKKKQDKRKQELLSEAVMLYKQLQVVLTEYVHSYDPLELIQEMYKILMPNSNKPKKTKTKLNV